MLDETDQLSPDTDTITQRGHPDKTKLLDVIAIIDQVGVLRIADELKISEQAVRRWRTRNHIPDDRLESVHKLLRGCADPGEVSLPASGFETSEVAGGETSETSSLAAPGFETSEVAGGETSETSSPAAPGFETSEAASLETSETSSPAAPGFETSEVAGGETRETSSPTAPGFETSEVASDETSETSSPVAPGFETSKVADGETSLPTPNAKPSEHLDPKNLEGPHARRTMALYIAGRDVDLMRSIADRAAADAVGLPPVSPVRWYWLRLAVLFALDFPILTMAFVAVTEASPVIAAGSAIALSLGLVLCAHAAGAQLRALSAHIPDWLQSLATLVLMILLIVAVIGVAADLRSKGFEIEGLSLENQRAGIFSQQTELPDSLKSAIVRAAGLVTILLTVFGITWSYQNHGPQQTYAAAERSYRRALRRYAKAVKRSGSKPCRMLAAVLIAAVVASPGEQARAADCGGPTVLTLVDTTTAIDEHDRRRLMPAIDQMVRSLKSDDRLIIRTVRDAPGSSRLLLDTCVPGEPSFEWSARGLWTWLMTSPATLRTKQAQLKRSIRDAVLPELTQVGEAEGTALIDTLVHFAAADRPNAIWMLSDLLESMALPTSSLLATSDSLLDARDVGMSMSGIDVYVAGFGRFHDRDRRALTPAELGTLLDAWTAIVRRSGGELHLVDHTDQTALASDAQR